MQPLSLRPPRPARPPPCADHPSSSSPFPHPNRLWAGLVPTHPGHRPGGTLPHLRKEAGLRHGHLRDRGAHTHPRVWAAARLLKAGVERGDWRRTESSPPKHVPCQSSFPNLSFLASTPRSPGRRGGGGGRLPRKGWRPGGNSFHTPQTPSPRPLPPRHPLSLLPLLGVLENPCGKRRGRGVGGEGDTRAEVGRSAEGGLGQERSQHEGRKGGNWPWTVWLSG